MSTLAATSSPCHGNKTRGIANALTGLGKNVLRFRISSTSSRAQVGCYFWKPDPSADADSDDLEFSVGIFSGSWLPEELSKLDLVQISHKELSSGIWLIWDIDSSEDFNLLLKPGSSDSRYYFNGILLDAASADAEHKDNFLVGKSAAAPPGLCGGMYLGPWDQDYHVPNSPSSPDGAPRLTAYNLNAGKSTRINRKHFDGASKHPAALPKMPAWLDVDPAAIGLDELEIKRVAEVFHKFDHDNNQVIDRHEMSRVAKHVYEILKEQPVTPEQIDLLFEKYDTNRDKQLSLIEFQKIFLSIKKEMIREGLLPPYPKHFQWRVSSHVPHVSSIKRRVDTPEPSDGDWGQMAMYQPANTSMYQFFNPQFYQNASYEPAALYQHQAQQPLYQPAFTVPYYEDSSSSDDSDDDLFTPSPFQFPQPATGMSHKLMFPELPCLQELSYLKHELPYQDYVQVQAGFLRFLKMRLGFSEAPLPRLPHPHHQFYAAPPHHHPYAAHSAHYQHHPHGAAAFAPVYPAAAAAPAAPAYQAYPTASYDPAFYAAAPHQAAHEHTYGPNCSWTLQYAQMNAGTSSEPHDIQVEQSPSEEGQSPDEHKHHHEHDADHGDVHHHDHASSEHAHHHDDHEHHSEPTTSE